MKYTINHLGVLGHGDTKRAAKLDAERRVTELVDAQFVPVLLRCPPYPSVILVFRSGIDSWSYRFIEQLAGNQNAQNAYTREMLHATQSFGSIDEAIRSARRHAAQLDCDVMSDDRSGFEWIETLHDRDLHAHLSWVGWQREYRRLTAAGKTDMEARNMIGTTRYVTTALEQRFIAKQPVPVETRAAA